MSRARAGLITPGAAILAAWIGLGPAPVAQESPTGDATAAVAQHDELFRENRFPSATTCRTCHPDHYREWSVSSHAYATMSPVFNAMHGKILELTNGTNGDFCIRCHSPVAMNLEEPEFMSNIDRHPTSREGITCITCHRVDLDYGKVSGRLAIVEGDLFAPIYGPTGNDELARALESGEFNMNTDRSRSGRNVHGEVVASPRMSQTAQCASCHDVNLVNGFRLEEAFSEFAMSPAARRGETCQDCHMGRDPGVASGYDEAPAAVVGGRPTASRKRTNHMFAGPDYSVIHPGIFPHNGDAARLATIREWLEFDHEAGWGTDPFEDSAPDDYPFPERWRSADDRYDARDILRDNTELLEEARRQRLAVLRAGYRLGEIVVDTASDENLRFRVEVRNGTDGHNVPTGFDAERLVWLHVTVVDATGRVLLESGDLDPNGDVRDSHSLYVHDGEMPLDRSLFSLQSRFLTRMVRGGEREQVLAVNYSPDPLPFLRPSTRSTILTGQPLGARKHRQTIVPLGGVWAPYELRADDLAGAIGPVRARVELKAAMVPVNLIDAIKDVGFDYDMSAAEVARAVVAGHEVLWEDEVELSRPGPAVAAATPLAVPRPGAQGPMPASGTHAPGATDPHDSALPEHPIPLRTAEMPERPKPLLELGSPFLGSGRIGRGVKIPGGAVWQPSFLLFGRYRSSAGVFGDSADPGGEWANRLDLFGNLYLTGTERLVFGLRPLDRTAEDGRRLFSGFGPGADDPSRGFHEQFNLDWDTVSHLFFEGDVLELIPALDPEDRRGLDFGFSVGRQPIRFQEGLLIDDTIDAVGLTRNNLKLPGTANARITGLFGWGQLNRHAPAPVGRRNLVADSSRLVGLFTEVDLRATTFALDAIYIDPGTVRAGAGSALPVRGGFHAGLSFVQRLGTVNTAFRVLGSLPSGAADPEIARLADPWAGRSGGGRFDPSTRGALLFVESSWTPTHSHDLFYATAFWAAGRYRAAALDPTVPGPLARAGILFAGPGIGGFTGGLSPAADRVVGGAFGHQRFFARTRRQLIVEVAGRYGTGSCDVDLACEPHALAAGARYQVALGRRFVVALDGFGAYDRLRGADRSGAADRFRFGSRVELLLKF